MKNKAVFIDRDGVINKNLFDENDGLKSPSKPSEFIFLPRVIGAIKLLKKIGFKIAVVSNQPGVAFGNIKETVLTKITKKMRTKIDVDGVYYCKHHPDYTGECICRKPKDGLLKKAANRLNVDISQSYMIGDNLTDIKAGKNCKNTFLVAFNFNTIKQIKAKGTKADYYVYDLYDAAKIIKQLEVG
jgi:D,D-heptose 1,7-bisphosphate phosphatase